MPGSLLVELLQTSKVHDMIKSTESSSAFISGHTYQGHAIGCAAGLAVQKTLVRDDLLTNVV